MVRQIPDDHYQREGDDIITHVRIRLEDALSEGKVDVPHLDGRILRVPLKEVGLPRLTLYLLLCEPFTAACNMITRGLSGALSASLWTHRSLARVLCVHGSLYKQYVQA